MSARRRLRAAVSGTVARWRRRLEKLEVLCKRPIGGGRRLFVQPSIDGYEAIWRATINRFLIRHNVAADFEINDFGATPATVSSRLE